MHPGIRRIAGPVVLAAALTAAILVAGPRPTAAAPADTTAIAPRSFPRLEIREKGTENAWVAYGDQPALGYGPSPQNLLTCLPPGEARDRDLDYRDFAEWAFAHGITIVRSYPPSTRVGPRYLDLFERSASDTSKFDLDHFNDAYYARLREACTELRARGIFVHLQLWQAVTWKKNWDDCYYNPANNVNPSLVKNAGPAAFVIDPKNDAALVAHQREHVRRILEATGDLGNVYYDVMNEIGNGTGVSGPWVEAMLEEIEAWESKSGLDVLVGINDEGRDRDETAHPLTNPRFDVAFLDQGRYDEHAEMRTKLKKPTFGIRNVDWNPETRTREYFAGEQDIAINPDPGIASRTRRTFWRLFMAKAQMCPAYADLGRQAYRGKSLVALDLWPFQNLRRIVTKSPWVENYAEMRVAPGLVKGAPTPHTYALDSERLILLFFESTPGTAGVKFEMSEIQIAGHEAIGKPEARIMIPSTSLWIPAKAARRGGDLIVPLPEFMDELFVVIFDSAQDPEYTSVLIGDLLKAEVQGGTVQLSWPRNPEGLIARVHRLRADFASRGELSATPTLLGGTMGLTTIDDSPGPGEWMYTIVWKDEVKRQLMETKGVTVTVPDRAPFTPEVRPVRVEASRAKLWAAGNLDPDVTRYEWERRAAGTEAWEALPATESAILEDVGLQRGAALEYRARAMDAAGQASEWSAATSVTPEATRIAAAPGSGVAKARTIIKKPVAIAATILVGLVLGVIWGRFSRRRR